MTDAAGKTAGKQAVRRRGGCFRRLVFWAALLTLTALAVCWQRLALAEILINRLAASWLRVPLSLQVRRLDFSGAACENVRLGSGSDAVLLERLEVQCAPAQLWRRQIPRIIMTGLHLPAELRSGELRLPLLEKLPRRFPEPAVAEALAPPPVQVNQIDLMDAAVFLRTPQLGMLVLPFSACLKTADGANWDGRVNLELPGTVADLVFTATAAGPKAARLEFSSNTPEFLLHILEAAGQAPQGISLGGRIAGKADASFAGNPGGQDDLTAELRLENFSLGLGAGLASVKTAAADIRLSTRFACGMAEEVQVQARADGLTADGWVPASWSASAATAVLQAELQAAGAAGWHVAGCRASLADGLVQGPAGLAFGWELLGATYAGFLPPAAESVTSEVTLRGGRLDIGHGSLGLSGRLALAERKLSWRDSHFELRAPADTLASGNLEFQADLKPGGLNLEARLLPETVRICGMPLQIGEIRLRTAEIASPELTAAGLSVPAAAGLAPAMNNLRLERLAGGWSGHADFRLGIDTRVWRDHAAEAASGLVCDPAAFELRLAADLQPPAAAGAGQRCAFKFTVPPLNLTYSDAGRRVSGNFVMAAALAASRNGAEVSAKAAIGNLSVTAMQPEVEGGFTDCQLDFSAAFGAAAGPKSGRILGLPAAARAEARLDGGRFGWPAQKMSVAGGSLHSSWRWPFVQEERPVAGRIEFGALQSFGQTLAPFGMELNQTGAAEWLAAGETTVNGDQEATLRLEHKLRLFPSPRHDAKIRLEIGNLERAAASLATLLPAAARQLTLGGRLRADIVLRQDAAGTGGGGSVCLHEVRLSNEKARLAVEKLDGEVQLSRLWPLQTAPRQKLRFASVILAGVPFGKGEAVFQLAMPDAVFLDAARLDWCGGRLVANAVSFSPGKGDFQVDMFSESLDIGELFKLQSTVRGRAQGRMFGKLPVAFRDGRFTIGGGYLFADPGSDPRLWLRDPGAFLGSGTGQVNQVAAVLENMQVEMLRLHLPEEGGSETPTMELQIHGRAAADDSLPPGHLNTKIFMDLQEVLGTARMFKKLKP